MLYFKLLVMEINLNCDLGEKSKHHSNENDPELLKIVNSANVACGYHAGDEQTMQEVVKISKENNVSIGAHPSFKDPENFGRKRMDLSASEITKLVTDQYEILQNIASLQGEKVSHIKPHGALNNMSSLDPAIATAIARGVNLVDPKLILVAVSGSFLFSAGQALGLTVAAEAYADRSYEDDGNMTSRKYDHAMIKDPEKAAAQVRNIVIDGYIIANSGKKVPVRADTICIHGDEPTGPAVAQAVRKMLDREGIAVKPLPELNFG